MSEAEIAGYLIDNHNLSAYQAEKFAHVIFRKLDFSSLWEQIETLFCEYAFDPVANKIIKRNDRHHFTED